MHADSHELMGQTVTIKRGPYAGREMVLVDWWDHRMQGKSWRQSAADGIPPAQVYNARVLQSNAQGEFPNDLVPLPMDDEVIHCVARDIPHPDGQGMIRQDIFIHASELEDATD